MRTTTTSSRTRPAMPALCRAGCHVWSYRINDEGQTYYVCTRCHRESPRDYPWFGFTFGAAKR